MPPEEAAGYGGEELREFAKKLHEARARREPIASIDEFLKENPNYYRLGHCLIALKILMCLSIPKSLKAGTRVGGTRWGIDDKELERIREKFRRAGIEIALEDPTVDTAEFFRRHRDLP